jgi:hypothetical protein
MREFGLRKTQPTDVPAGGAVVLFIIIAFLLLIASAMLSGALG